ncbi:MAG: DUF2235 domain-containing protein [Acidobacteria bacterium]|nr:DUF2235 domain-containing protein [Acidobacteriota bacterium]
MKKIVLFADGTGNSSASPQKTNVWRAYQALDRTPDSNQVAFYDNGVGTSSFTPFAILGLAFGWGVARNVKQIYGFLCRTYDPGDAIYAFGFSRGAFTIRMVVALIANQGIIDRTRVSDENDLDRLIAAAYHRFRRENFTPSFLSFFLRPVRDWFLHVCHGFRGLPPYNKSLNIMCPSLVKFVGVWDTVDAYGLPIDELTRAWDMVVWPLTAKDRNLSNRVEHARHALSLDEQRESFEPMLWNEHNHCRGTKVTDARLAQAWFPGVHANVGGGYPDDALALVPLMWIVDESTHHGLQYLTHEYNSLRNQAATYAPAHDSRSGDGAFYRYAPRNIEQLNDDSKPGLANWIKAYVNALSTPLRVTPIADVHDNSVKITKPLIHHTVFDRILRDGNAYAPINIPADYDVLTDAGNIVEGSKAGYETEKQAADRRTTQSWLWNKVLVRKLLYLATLITMVTFAACPLLPGRDDGDGLIPFLETWVGTLAVVVCAIPDTVGRVPGLGFVGSWAGRYSEYPITFVGFLTLIGILLLWSRKVRDAIRAEMRGNWSHAAKPTVPVDTAVGSFRRTVADWRERWGSSVSRSSRIGLETVAVFFLLFMVLAACSRLVFTVAEGLGGVCGRRPDVAAEFGQQFTFVPTELCFDTGLAVKEGEEYEIDFRISTEWRDQTLRADVIGWTNPPLYMYGFTPLRRYLFVNWYEPVARVGASRFDIYPLAVYGSVTGKENDRLIARIGARRSGRLYLYLNDAVLFTWGAFYRNNKGTAAVTVRHVASGQYGTNGNDQAKGEVEVTLRGSTRPAGEPLGC